MFGAHVQENELRVRPTFARSFSAIAGSLKSIKILSLARFLTENRTHSS